MKTEVVWTDRIPERDNAKSVVYDMAFRPDGTQVLIAVGNRILVYDCEDGSLLHSLRGHKDSVYAVAYSKDGKRFASGSADKSIIIWTPKCEGILKYSHNDSIQCLTYNPVTQQLASATASDFGLWSPEQKSVNKFKVSAKVLCASWTNDGQYLALGQFNGHISLRDKQGVEKVRIERSSPVWTLQFSPLPRDTLVSRDPSRMDKEKSQSDNSGKEGAAVAASVSNTDILAVGCWDQTLSFYQISGQQQGKDAKLDFDPCSLSYYDDGEYILVGGSDRKVSLYSKEGVFLKQVCEKEDWVFCVRNRPKHKQLMVGCNDGYIALHSTLFSTVHGLYQDRYAHRENLTDVILQHLISEQKVRIKCKDYVKKIAVYRDRLAVQLSERILIYETVNNDPYDMHYRLKEKISKKLDCNLLVVTADNIILCQEKKLQLLDLKGNKVREWVLEAVIRYIRVVGGPAGREGLLVGLKNGSVLKFFIDNSFPVQLIRHEAPIRCLDLSCSRHKLAVVDENSKLFVYDLSLTAKDSNLNTNKDNKGSTVNSLNSLTGGLSVKDSSHMIIFSDVSVNSVAWNTEMEDMFSYSGNGQLSIKTGDFPVHRQPLQGFVVGFKGSKIFCLHYLNMQTIDVPQSASLYRYLDRKEYENAYAVACLGVTESDWRELALHALTGLSLDIARKAFIRIRDIKFIELLNRIEIARKAPLHDDTLFLAEIFAYKGEYDEAARLYVRANKPKTAIQMFLDLRDWDKAKALVEQLNQEPNGNSKELTTSTDGTQINMSQLVLIQAKWLEDLKEYKPAAEMYWAGKDYMHALTLLGDNGWYDDLMEKVRLLNKNQKRELELASSYLRKSNQYKYAQETFLKMDDIKSLMALHVEQHKWDEAFALVKTHPEYAAFIYEPYAEYLASNDMFEEAHKAFIKAGKPEQSVRMLAHLSSNAIAENRFSDAAYYFWLLANEYLKKAKDSPPSTNASANSTNKKWIERFLLSIRQAQIYHAYANIYKYTEDPFTSLQPEVVFQTSQFIMNQVTSSTPSVQSLALSSPLSSPALSAKRLNRSAKSMNGDRNKHVLNSASLVSTSVSRFLNFVLNSSVEEFGDTIVEGDGKPLEEDADTRSKSISQESQVVDRMMPHVQSAINLYENKLLAAIKELNPIGVSKVYTLFALAKQAKQLGAYKLARQAFSKLVTFKLPNHWLNIVDVTALSLRSLPFTDPEHLLTTCYRCSSTSSSSSNSASFVSNAHDVCANCSNAFVRSAIGWEVLPLVEFFVDEDITDEEAEKLLKSEPPRAQAAKSKIDIQANVQSMRLDDDEDEIAEAAASQANDPFHLQLLNGDTDIETGVVPAIRIDRKGLLICPPSEVFIRKWGWNLAADDHSKQIPRGVQFYRSVVPDIQIVKCENCQQFFYAEDYEVHVLSKHSCPFCRTPVDNDF